VEQQVDTQKLVDVLSRVAALDSHAQRLLARHEDAPARTITLEASYTDLQKLSIAQDELFRESLRAIEVGLFRAAHVLAWAGFIDLLHNILFADSGVALKVARPNWQLDQPDDLREHADFAVIEAGKVAGAYNKTQMKALHGLLNKRNECAHPSDFFPDLNESLGYLSELIQRVAMLQRASW
jgi:hypothetical protein